MTSYTVGDPILLCDDTGEDYGVIVDHVDADTVEVQLLEKDDANGMYRIGSKCYHVKHVSIVQHVPLDGDDDKAPAAFDTLGFRMIDGENFVKHSDEVGDRLFPVGDAAFEPCRSEDDSDEEGSLKDFIVPDAECEPFTHARADNSFVRETHAAVRAFNEWVPKTEQEVQARSFMIRQESRASHLDDEARFARGMPGGNYKNPE